MIFNSRSIHSVVHIAQTCLGLLLFLMWLAFPLGPKAGSQESLSKKPAQQASSPSRICYAFLRDNSLWAVCQGKREHIQLGTRLADFAVSADGSKLVVQKEDQSTSSATGTFGGSSLTIIGLKEMQETTTIKISATGSLYETCGTVVFFDFVTSSALDVLGSTPLQFPPYQYFRCSSDRRVIAGWTEQDNTESEKRARSDINEFDRITLRTGPSSESTLGLILGPMKFDVSPNGDFVSYYTLLPRKPGPDLCVSRLSGSRWCVLEGGEQTAVADNGDVIFWRAGDRLSEIRYWHLGSTKTVLLEKEASSPQWITPDTAAALHEWNLRHEGQKAPLTLP